MFSTVLLRAAVKGHVNDFLQCDDSSASCNADMALMQAHFFSSSFSNNL